MKQKIFIPTTNFISWNGGVDYIKFIIRILIRSLQNNPERSLTILIPTLSPKEKLKNIKYKIKGRAVKGYLSADVFCKDPEIAQAKIKIIKYYPLKYSGRHSLNAILAKEAHSILFPVFEIKSAIENVIQVGYIADLQHLDIPDNFTQVERESRDKHFINQLRYGDGVIVNSQDVKNKILHHYPQYAQKTKIFASPFLPILNENILTATPDLSKYTLPEKYFIVCNQLWMHKDHPTAIKALAQMHRNGYNDIYLICTGLTSEYRRPTYFDEIKQLVADEGLSKYVRFLGFVSKEEQIAMLRNSISLIQPTLYEGGPGGGSVYDAIAYGVPAVVSDITINKEITAENITFFKQGDYIDLTHKMQDALTYTYERPSNEKLIANKIKNIDRGVLFIEQIIKETAATTK